MKKINKFYWEYKNGMITVKVDGKVVIKLKACIKLSDDAQDNIIFPLLQDLGYDVCNSGIIDLKFFCVDGTVTHHKDKQIALSSNESGSEGDK